MKRGGGERYRDMMVHIYNHSSPSLARELESKSDAPRIIIDAIVDRLEDIERTSLFFSSHVLWQRLVRHRLSLVRIGDDNPHRLI